jgi:putative Mg2+ transporter-C (MgtC) family protein
MTELDPQNINQQLWILLDVFIAILLGGVVGYERERKNKPAGFRTHMIIAGSTALLYSLGRVLVDYFHAQLDFEALGIDPTRILHAIIVGVSFIGAGTILKARDQDKVYFLTTSATILLSASVGISVAMRQYIIAIGVTVFILIINTVFHKIEHRKT